MNVLFVTSECAPFVKTGGLADVAGALPKALEAVGVSTKVLLPAYQALNDLAGKGTEVLQRQDPTFGPLSVRAVKAEGVDLLLLVAPHLFDRPGNPYVDENGRDFQDNPLRFGALSKVGADIARMGLDGFEPDLLHAHDWQAGLAPAYLAFDGGPRAPCVTTIHNIAFQGVFPDWVAGRLGLPAAAFNVNGYEYHGHMSFLKAGLYYADKITTVSPTYAREIMQARFGLGFEGLLATRKDDLVGILNGVDLDVWNPATDKHLRATYDADSLDRRRENRAALMERFGLSLPDDAPLFCVVSRLTGQKGIDLVVASLGRILQRGGGLAVLGSGERELENDLMGAAHHVPERVGLVKGYDEPLSHLLQGGADVILVPSRFEPCGLTQLYGLRYGCLPLVARTGGLADTVIDANEAAIAVGVANGFQFAPITAPDLRNAVDRVCDAFEDREGWRAMMANAMRQPVGWTNSAQAYKRLYGEVIDAAKR